MYCDTNAVWHGIGGGVRNVDCYHYFAADRRPVFDFGGAIILIVLFQSGKSQGLSGTIGGIADSYMAKSKAKSLDAKLAKGTKWVGAVFIVLTLVINCMLAAAA